MNKKTRVLTEEQYTKIISMIQSGFVTKDGHVVHPNKRIAVILVLEANLGLRVSDVLKLSLSSIVQDGTRYRFDIMEKKTKKKREFTVPIEVYSYIQQYALENNIKPKAKLFQITARTVQNHLKLVCDYMGYENISTHSFRKFFASSIYINNNYNIELVRILLQHSSVVTTQRYIGVGDKQLEEALHKNVRLM